VLKTNGIVCTVMPRLWIGQASKALYYTEGAVSRGGRGYMVSLRTVPIKPTTELRRAGEAIRLRALPTSNCLRNHLSERCSHSPRASRLCCSDTCPDAEKENPATSGVFSWPYTPAGKRRQLHPSQVVYGLSSARHGKHKNRGKGESGDRGC
jgi:hypothetical protein